MSTWGHMPCPRLRNPLEQNSSLPQGLPSHEEAHTTANGPFPDASLSITGISLQASQSGQIAF